MQVRALEELRGAGDIAAYGAGINHTGTMTKYLDLNIDMDFFLVSQASSHSPARRTPHSSSATPVSPAVAILRSSAGAGS